MKKIYITFIALCFLSSCQQHSALESLKNGTKDYVKVVELGDKIRFDESTCDENIICGNSAVEPSSIISLLGNPTNWAGKAISVKGFIHSDNNGTSLFMTTEHCIRKMSEYSIQIDTSTISELEESLSKNQICLEAYIEGVYSPYTDRSPTHGVFMVRNTPSLLALKYILVWDIR